MRAVVAAGRGVVTPWIPPFDVTMLVCNGQSLAMGLRSEASPDASQPYNNVQLWDSSGNYNLSLPAAPSLELQPLVCPMQSNSGLHLNMIDAGNVITKEVADVRAANQITALAKAQGYPDYPMATANTGISGAGYSVISKGGSGNSYAMGLYEATALNRLVRALPGNKSFGVGAIVLIHGETDKDNASYGTDIATMQADYESDLKAITGQTRPIPLLLVQQCGAPGIHVAAQLQWQASFTSAPGKILCVGGGYTAPRYIGDYLHLTAAGYVQYGEAFAKSYMKVEAWQQGLATWASCQPLQPTSYVTSNAGKTITITFNTPVAPLVLDGTVFKPWQYSTDTAYPAWKNGFGFEAYTGGVGGSAVTINSVTVSAPNQITIVCASAPDTIAYAYQGSSLNAWPSAYATGCLRDSDPAIGLSGNPIYNWCVGFWLSV